MRIVVENVDFSYRGLFRPRGKPVLRGASWTVEPGVTGLMGPNGAGKTTLLSLLVTLAAPQHGRVLIGEHDVSRPAGRREARRLLGFVPQRFSLAGELTVADTVSYAAWVNGVPRRACGGAAAGALALVDAAALAARKVRTLSGGERQRVGIAAALAHDPRILVLDEPTVGLDPGQRLRAREVIARLGASRTVLLSTHLVEDVAHLCERVGVLAAGRIAFQGTFAELEALAEDSDPGRRYGSAFEHAYDRLIARVGATS
ncbi:ATP-binding cassette domain-containing protein [Sinosporangium siamense]|uniref:ATP-binding cassette domain-containing protein n=1 Tax=Sinosporangium siamense TaxID=1367973 RepID=UPI001EF2D94F|nr:ATP-binding cassette domain-containing protein [Sinosporangium siamense]